MLESRGQEEGALFWMASLNLDIGIYSVPRRAKGGKKLQEQLKKKKNMRGVWRRYGSECRGGVCGAQDWVQGRVCGGTRTGMGAGEGCEEGRGSWVQEERGL